jgi:Ca2+-binding RTX toxin-like protein
MSFVAPPASTIWDQTGNDPVATTPVWNGNPDVVDATSTPVQVSGANNTFTTTDAPVGTTAQILVTGQENTLNVGSGSAEIQSLGQGNVVESLQVLGDGTKIISTGTFGAGGESFVAGVAVSGTQATTGNVIGQSATINEMAGGMAVAGGFYSQATGGTGNDQLYGSAFSDFFRGGMGNDSIYAYGGNDVVRGGAGSDLISLGTGDDTLYYTFDQLQNGDIDTVTDFNTGGDVDKLAIQADRVGGGSNFDSFGGFGTDILSITDSDGSVTQVQAQTGYSWKTADIFFVV